VIGRPTSVSIRWKTSVTGEVKLLMRKLPSRKIVAIAVFSSRFFWSLSARSRLSTLDLSSVFTVSSSSLTDCSSSLEVSSSSFELCSSSFTDWNSSFEDFISSLEVSSSSMVACSRSRVEVSSASRC